MSYEVMIPNAAYEGMDQEQFPLTKRELLDRYGEVELDVAGSGSIADALEHVDDDTYESPEDVQHALHSGLSHEAVGRRFYSDRDPTPPGTPNAPDQLSF